MHSHIHAIRPNLLNSYSARALEKTDASERASDVRKKLLGTAGEIEVEADGGTDWMVGPGYQGGSQQGSGRRGYDAGGEAKTDEPDHVVESISVWV